MIFNQLNHADQALAHFGATLPFFIMTTPAGCSIAYASPNHPMQSLPILNTFAKMVMREGVEVWDEDVARLSPLVHHHINFQGCYSFALSEAVARGELRPLRDPDEFDY